MRSVSPSVPLHHPHAIVHCPMSAWHLRCWPHSCSHLCSEKGASEPPHTDSPDDTADDSTAERTERNEAGQRDRTTRPPPRRLSSLQLQLRIRDAIT